MAQIFLHLTELQNKNEIEKIVEKITKAQQNKNIKRNKRVTKEWNHLHLPKRVYYRSLIIHKVNLNYHLPEKTEK